MLKKPFITYKINQSEKKRSFSKSFDFAKSKKIALVFNSASTKNAEQIIKINSTLKAEGKEISTLAFCKNRKKSTLTYPLFDTKDIGAFGSYKTEELNAFMKQDYDMVLCADESDHYIIRYILSQIKASCRIGLSLQDAMPQYEMIIKSEAENIRVEEVLKYLKMIHSNEH
ncbi:MAG: hypothetical protein ABJ004_15600 [Cyclobacteriaceae bacterium]